MGWNVASVTRGLKAVAFGLLVTTAMAAPAAAEDQAMPAPEPGQLAIEGVGKLMRALELFMQSIPTYGQPYVDEQGNIVIPKLGDPSTPALETPSDQTGTTT